MHRNDPDDATRKGSADVAAIEGLLAFAQTRPRWSGGAALSSASEAIARSRVLAGKSPEEHTELLSRCLRTTAKLLLKRGKATEALPLAQEAVALARSVGGGPLVVSLMCLARVFEALHRYSEAAATMAEADRIPPTD
ncbi:tetratricopeptide repeat protein [Nonomuraea sp. NPDC049709]|uniref:tetratricopeptide repeat protein n=1 Tax=Nonomuraea sp. NPDC049709 TaxID=3154736 RepID=UPI00341A9EA6